VGLLPRTHGSGLFTRGLTQVLNIAPWFRAGRTEAGRSYAGGEPALHASLQLPPYSTGEVKRMGTPGRREVGHGALVREPHAVVGRDTFPILSGWFSEVLSSNAALPWRRLCRHAFPDGCRDSYQAPVAGMPWAWSPEKMANSRCSRT